MSKLEAFLKHNIEDYLIHDLREMQRTEVTYPLLMTTFAGIELLGALFSNSRFDTYSGDTYFRFYWDQYLYPTLANKESIGQQLYSLLRHGIAHAFFVKGPVTIGRSQPSNHLTINADGVLYVDAVLMADNFVSSYSERVKPLLTDPTSAVIMEMSRRMNEMELAYAEEAAKKLHASHFPSGTVATTAAVSHSFGPGLKIENDS